MSDTDPGGWVRAEDGRWYPPGAVPPSILRRGPGGSFVLDPSDPSDEEPPEVPGVTRRRRATDRPPDAPSSGQERGPARSGRRVLEAVGGPIRPTSTIHFGRPPGTENRQAGAAATVATVAFALAAVVPWATRTPDHLSPTGLGWRDANGDLGPGWVALLLALAAAWLAGSALRGRTDSWLRSADAAVGGAGLVVALVEGVRILRAGGLADEASDGVAAVSPSWGLLLVLGGSAALGVAAVVHRSQPPAWRQE